MRRRRTTEPKPPDRAERKRERDYQKILDRLNDANWKHNKPPLEKRKVDP